MKLRSQLPYRSPHPLGAGPPPLPGPAGEVRAGWLDSGWEPCSAVHSRSPKPQPTTTLSIDHTNPTCLRSPVVSLTAVVECCQLWEVSGLENRRPFTRTVGGLPLVAFTAPPRLPLAGSIPTPSAIRPPRSLFAEGSGQIWNEDSYQDQQTLVADFRNDGREARINPFPKPSE